MRAEIGKILRTHKHTHTHTHAAKLVVRIAWLYLYCVLIELNIYNTESLVKNQVRVHNILSYCLFSV